MAKFSKGTPTSALSPALAVTSSRRKCRKAHFTAHSNLRRKLMSCPLSKDLRKKYNVRSMPVRKEDEVMVVRGLIPRLPSPLGPYKSNKGKVTCVYRKRWYINVEKLSKPKINGKARTARVYYSRRPLPAAHPHLQLRDYQAEADQG